MTNPIHSQEDIGLEFEEAWRVMRKKWVTVTVFYGDREWTVRKWNDGFPIDNGAAR